LNEILLFMLLTLPPSLGGVGLSGATFNPKICFTPGNSLLLGKNFCYVDLYFSAKRTAVEYDSFAHHSTPAAQAYDAKRAMALRSQGYKVVRITTEQLYNPESFLSAARHLARCLGKRIRLRHPDYAQRCREIRDLLPRIEKNRQTEAMR